jgi:hypothetical protein
MYWFAKFETWRSEDILSQRAQGNAESAKFSLRTLRFSANAAIYKLNTALDREIRTSTKDIFIAMSARFSL